MSLNPYSHIVVATDLPAGHALWIWRKDAKAALSNIGAQTTNFVIESNHPAGWYKLHDGTVVTEDFAVGVTLDFYTDPWGLPGFPDHGPRVALNP